MNPLPRLNFDLPLLDKLSDGVVLLDRHAEVLSSNLAGRPWLRQVHGMAGVLKDLLDMEVRGRIKLPVKLGVWPAQSDDSHRSGEAWLIMNGRRDYAIFIAISSDNTGASAHFDCNKVTDSGFLSLLGDEARGQLARLRTLLQTAAGTSVRTSNDIIDQSLRVEHLLQELTDLSLLLQRDEIFGDDRLDIDSVVRAGFPPTTGEQMRQSPMFELRRQGSQTGIVYGHAVWMSYALRVLFEAMQASAPAHSQITVTTRQMGDFVVLVGRVVARMSADKSPDLKATAEPSVALLDKAALQRSAQVRWLIAKRIIALHAGQLKLEILPLAAGENPVTPPLESFTLTLATGEPIGERSRESCATCRHVLQANAYAVDLAQLLNPH